MITKTIGKNTLGDNGKMKVQMRTYNRSTHNLSYIWRNTQAVGTLVPFMSIPIMKGDTFKIKLQPNVLTHPTVGPLFGSFKLQNDIFFCPIRLYNSWLHNNKLKIGLNMQQIKLPQIVLSAETPMNDQTHEPNALNPSSLLYYLGIRAIGQNTLQDDPVARRTFNAVSFLSYFDIFKNYYANKQEDKFVTIAHTNIITKIVINDGKTVKTILDPMRINARVPDNNSTIEIFGTLDKDKVENITVKYYSNYNKDNHIEPTEITTRLADIFEIRSWTPANNSVTVKAKPNAHIDGANAIFWSMEYKEGKMVSHNLEDLDEIREKILAKAGNLSYNINGERSNPPFFQYLMTGSLTDPATGTDTIGTQWKYNDEWGLVTKTYQSDLCQNWINTEWIDGENGINQISAVAVTDGQFTIDSLNLAQKVYNMLNRIAVSDGSYRSWLETVYTGGYTERTETPIYCGGSSAEIVFQEVVSTAAADQEPLGSLAGRGLDTNHKGGYVEVRATEPGYLIGITSLTPRLDYTQGNQWDVNLKSIDDMHKPALDGIGFQDLSAELLLADTTVFNGENFEQKFIGKQPAWINYMTNINKAYGNFTTNENFMILSRQYEYNKTTRGIKDLTTYIDPTLYNGIFADQSFNAQNFWVQIGVEIEARRVMSAKIIPNL
jgi:hypothetical protein